MDEDSLLEELKKLDVPVHETVNAFFGGTQALFQAATPICKVISSLQGNRSDLEDALAGTYYRMHLCIESLTRLNNKRDFQVAIQVTRCIYELYVDLVELNNDPSLVPQFFAFPFVSKFSAAIKLVEEIDSQVHTDPTLGKHERAFVTEPKNIVKYDAERLKYWGATKGGQPRTPLSWSDKTLPERAKAIGKDEILRYRTIYSLFCWYAHAGVVGIVNMSADGLESAMGVAHGHAQELFCEATNRIADVFKIYEANPTLKAAVDESKEATGKILAAYMVKMYGHCTKPN